MEAEVRIPKVGKTAWHVMTIKQATQWWNEIAFLQKLQIDLYKKYLPAIRSAAGH